MTPSRLTLEDPSTLYVAGTAVAVLRREGASGNVCSDSDRLHFERIWGSVGGDLSPSSESSGGTLSETLPRSLRARFSLSENELAALIRGLPGPETIHFLRGVVDAVAQVSWMDEGGLRLLIPSLGPALDGWILAIVGAVGRAGVDGTLWVGSGALDVLGRLYELTPDGVRPSHRALFERACLHIGGLAPETTPGLHLRVQRIHPDAVLPKKERVSDSGYDLTLLYLHKQHGSAMLYGTGLIVEPPTGWYFDVIARSSIIKLGYILANSVGVIDRSYRGEIFVPLLKVDPNAPELSLPARLAQLVPRPIVHFPVREVSQLGETDRGTGGFGSTGP